MISAVVFQYQYVMILRHTEEPFLQVFRTFLHSNQLLAGFCVACGLLFPDILGEEPAYSCQSNE